MFFDINNIDLEKYFVIYFLLFKIIYYTFESWLRKRNPAGASP